MSDISSYEVVVEFEVGSWTNVTDDVTIVDISHFAGDMITGLSPGEISIELENQGGFYTQSVSLIPNLQVMVSATHQGSTRALFRGYVDEWSLTPDLSGPRRVTLSGRDALKILQNNRLVSSLYANLTVTSLYTIVLSQSTINSFQVDTMKQIVPFADVSDETFLNAIDSFLGINHATAYVCPQQCFRVDGPYAPIQASVVASLSDASSCIDLGWSVSDDKVYNKITVETSPREVVADATSIAAIGAPVFVPALGYASFWLDYVDPVRNESAPAVDVALPVASEDYSIFQNEDGTGTDYTFTTSIDTTVFGSTAINSVSNNANVDVYMTRFFLQGKPARALSDIRVTKNQSSSQSIYTEIELTHANDLIGGVLKADNFAEYLSGRYAFPAANVTGTWRNLFPTALDAIVGGAVNLVSSFTNTASNYFVRGVEHKIDAEGGWIHDVTFDLELISGTDVLVLDHAILGKLDIRRLGF